MLLNAISAARSAKVQLPSLFTPFRLNPFNLDRTSLFVLLRLKTEVPVAERVNKNLRDDLKRYVQRAQEQDLRLRKLYLQRLQNEKI